MKGTKLWQEPRSPLISGRSRREAPFVRDWLLGSLFAAIVAVGAAVWLGDVSGTDSIAVWLTRVVLIAGGAIIGSAPLLWLARRLGWRPSWIAGTVGGTLGAWAAVAAFAATSFATVVR